MEKKNYYLDSRIEAVEDLKKVLEYERIRSVGITEKRFTVHLSELTSIEKPMWFINDTEHEIILSAIESKRDCEELCKCLNALHEENQQYKQLIKKVLETTPINHSLAIELKNSVRELYD